VGLDLSLTSTGLAAIRDGKVVGLGHYRTKGHKGMTINETHDRIKEITGAIVNFAESNNPDLIVIEAPSFGSSHGSGHERAGLWWSVITALVDRYGFIIPIVGVAPATRAKYITGNGRATKDVVIEFARHAYTKGAGFRIANDDEADALGLAAMGSRFLGYPIEPYELTEGQMASMGVPKWPSAPLS
jgi:Holliday junction resolvasome RuvABC endonuclease subunit